jgi:hypothetical protein
MNSEEARMYLGLRANSNVEKPYQSWNLLDRIAARELLKEIHRLNLAVSAQRAELERRQRHDKPHHEPKQNPARTRNRSHVRAAQQNN